jgi:hypothetical protein
MKNNLRGFNFSQSDDPASLLRVVFDAIGTEVSNVFGGDKVISLQDLY